MRWREDLRLGRSCSLSRSRTGDGDRLRRGGVRDGDAWRDFLREDLRLRSRSWSREGEDERLDEGRIEDLRVRSGDGERLRSEGGVGVGSKAFALPFALSRARSSSSRDTRVFSLS